MVDEREPQFVQLQRRSDRRRHWKLPGLWPRRRPAGALPAQEIAEGPTGRSIRVEEPRAIEVVADGTVMAGTSAHGLRQARKLGDQRESASPAG